MQMHMKRSLLIISGAVKCYSFQHACDIPALYLIPNLGQQDDSEWRALI